MSVQRVAQIFGWVFVLIGVLGFFATDEEGRLLGLFPVNTVHNLVHLAFGVWGILAARSWDAARTYCRAAGVIYLVLTILGFVDPDGFGLVPLGGNDIWLHAVLALALLFFGFTAREEGSAARATT
ncbi:MAG TPA: DUF4383 domain-containing protein [Gemmatimonadota bacterium]|jgi:hypothetical protein